MASISINSTSASRVSLVSFARRSSPVGPSSAPAPQISAGRPTARAVTHGSCVAPLGRCNARSNFSDWEAELEEYEQDMESYSPAPAPRKAKGKNNGKKSNKAMELASMNMMEDAMYGDLEDGPSPKKGKAKKAKKGRKASQPMFMDSFEEPADQYEADYARGKYAH